MGRPRDAAEAHEAEGAGNGDARPHVPVHEGDHDAHDRREDRERRHEAARMAVAHAVDKGEHEPQGKRRRDAGDERGELERG